MAVPEGIILLHLFHLQKEKILNLKLEIKLWLENCRQQWINSRLMDVLLL